MVDALVVTFHQRDRRTNRWRPRGVFDVAGHWIARHGRHRMWMLWLFFSVFAISCTVFLSLDRTAVLLTPVALAIARQIDVAPRPFGLNTLWIANTGSLFLPVSNLTNLLAIQRFGQLGVGHAAYIRLAIVPAMVSIVVTLVVIAALHWRDLGRRYAVDPPADPHDPGLLRIAVAVCVFVGPAFAVGLAPWAVATAVAGLLIAATLWRAPPLLRPLPVPGLMAGGFAALTVVVRWARDAGYLQSLVALAGAGTGVGDLLRVAGVTPATSNAVNNLPAYLALEAGSSAEPVRLMAVLVGANVGPLVTRGPPWPPCCGSRVPICGCGGGLGDWRSGAGMRNGCRHRRDTGSVGAEPLTGGQENSEGSQTWSGDEIPTSSAEISQSRAAAAVS